MLIERSPITRFLPAVLGALISLTVATAARADATLDKIEQRHVLVVGVLLSGGPFGGIDPATQQPRGLNVDLAQELGRQLGAEVQLVPVLPANRVQFLQQGKVDLLIANTDMAVRSGVDLPRFCMNTEHVRHALLYESQKQIETELTDASGERLRTSVTQLPDLEALRTFMAIVESPKAPLEHRVRVIGDGIRTRKSLSSPPP